MTYWLPIIAPKAWPRERMPEPLPRKRGASLQSAGTKFTAEFELSASEFQEVRDLVAAPPEPPDALVEALRKLL